MSHSRNFNNNFHRSNYTFRYVPDFPPPPLPPPIFNPMRPPFFPPPPVYAYPNNTLIREKHDQDFIKTFESQIPTVVNKYKPITITISQIKEDIQCLVTTLKAFESKMNCLRDNIHKIPEDEWKKSIDEMNGKKDRITSKLEEFVGRYMDMSRKLLAKRTAKRLRLKRQKKTLQLAKDEKRKQLEEHIRKIDEHLQKVKDDIQKDQKAEEAKLVADVVLREVRRKKLDAKKCITKLSALLKLTKARQNTAKGRGETVSEKEVLTFVNNVEKLKTLWNQKLLQYEKEEIQLNAELAEKADGTAKGSENSQMGVEANLGMWREVLFGDANATPQVDFHGDVHRFIAVRSQWDQYINKDGTPLPIGWVVPS